MNDYKFTFKLTVITAFIVTLLIIISPYLFGYLGLDGQEYHPTVTTVTYDVLRTYDETNQSIYGTWRDYYVVTTEGKVFKVSSEEYYASKTTGKFTYRKY